MSDLEPDLILPPDTGTGGLDLDAIDPLGVARQSAPGYHAHGAQRSWAWLMYTMGRRAPANLAKSARYRQAMLKLRTGHRRMR